MSYQEVVIVSEEELRKREEELKMIARKIQDSGLQFPDVRDRKWLKIDSKVSRILKFLVDAEDIMVDLDEYQMENGQIYPEIEDMMLQLGELRNNFTNFVDNNLDLLELK